jgi:2-methylisocitrate lyase-like PEP mutase family enzyme
MRAQATRAESFTRRHTRPGIFVIRNPPDAGSAKLLAALEFLALAVGAWRVAVQAARGLPFP